MKNLFSILFAIIISLNLFAQDNYKVIKVNGSIMVQKSNSELQRGSVFDANDELNFKTSNARAAVINPGKGRFILMPNNSNVAYARANLTPSMNNISSRAGAIINKIDLSNYFSDNYVIIEKSYIKVSSSTFKMDDDNFFYIQYNYKGEDIPKKLKYKNDTIIINKTELFTIDGWPITNPNISKMELMYMSKEKGGSIYISSFNPIFPDSKELLSEIDLIIETVNNKSKEDKVKEVTGYINEMYGKIDKENVEIWLVENGKI